MLALESRSHYRGPSPSHFLQLSSGSPHLVLSNPTEIPGPPTNMAISNISPRSVTLQFKPGYDGKTSISCWQVEAQVSVGPPLPTPMVYILG